MSTAYKDALGVAVVYKDVTLGDGTKLPQSVPSDAAGAPLFTAANPAVTSATIFGATADTATPDLTATGASFTFASLFKGMVANLLAIKNALLGTVKTAPQSGVPRVTATGSLAAANAAVTLALDGMNTAVVQLSGTWVGTVAWSASADGGTTYVPVNLVPYGGGVAAGSASSNGLFEFACGGLTHLQAQMTAFTSGSATALLAAGAGLKSVRAGLSVAFSPVQNYVDVPAFVAGNTAGAGGSNATIALVNVMPANARFLFIDNTGSADAEIWIGSPVEAKVGQSPKRGKPVPAGAGVVLDVAVFGGVSVYATASGVTGLSFITG